jgi:hypothetical protein
MSSDTLSQILAQNAPKYAAFQVPGYDLISTQTRPYPQNVPRFQDVLKPKFAGWVQDEFNQMVLNARDKKMTSSQMSLFNDALKFIPGFRDTAYQLNTNEVTRLEEVILHVLRWDPIFEELCEVKQIGPGLTKYKYNTYIDIPAPAPTNTMEFKGNTIPLKSETTVDLNGLGYRYHIPRVVLDASKNRNSVEYFSESIDQATVAELTASLKQYRDWWLFRGADSPNMTDTGINGLVNNSGLTDPGAMGADADDNLTVAGDVYISATKLAGFLIRNKFKPPFKLHLSYGTLIQAMFNINTASAVNISDLQAINNLTTENGIKMFSQIRMNPYMIDSATETNTTGAMAAFAPMGAAGSNFYGIESYPLSYYPLPPQDLGMDGLLFWMGGVALPRPTAVAYVDALTNEVLPA